MSELTPSISSRTPLSETKATGPQAALADNAARQSQLPKSPRSDVGTVLLHWTTAITFLISLFTGIRIASDNPESVISKWMTPILPQGEIWSWHFFAGLTLFFCGASYFLYMRRSALSRRAAPKRLKVLLLPVVNKLRFAALNVALHWLLFTLVIILTGTGIALYLGYGGWVIYIHSTAAFVALGYIFVHVTSHYLMGGIWQLLRIVRPVKLIATKAMRPRPLLIGVASGLAVVAAIAGFDWITRDTLVMRRITVAPKLEALLDDPAWANARPVFIRTTQGINLSGTGESLVEIRTIRDDKKAYFAFRWEDPSRSVRRLPLVKKADGWHHIGNNPYIDDVTDFYEDKFAVIFSTSAAFGSGGVAHFGTKPIANEPGSRNGRGLHYTDGHMVDMWQWKPSRGGLNGHFDDMYIGPPRDPTPDEASKLARYQAGYWGDPGNAYYVYNFEALRPAEYRGPEQPVHIKRLPKDLAALQKAMGHWDPSPDASVDDGSRWWMTEEDSVPYSAEMDAKIPLGTIIPGVMHLGKYSGDRNDLRAAAHWQNGHWTLVAERNLTTGSKYDQDFIVGKDLYIWVSVFDHTQTRHTRHPRPMRLVVQE
ncbi:MAG: ethylbenzene dehydrogenase-related protein [Pseudolabrys sp.]|nr:ethylbenzene dehydrogenase-related protein [Pseudolabrys sp.]